MAKYALTMPQYALTIPKYISKLNDKNRNTKSWEFFFISPGERVSQ